MDLLETIMATTTAAAADDGALDAASPMQHDNTATSTPITSATASAAAATTWVGTQLRVAAVSGLASSHAEPFVRVLYAHPSRRSRGKSSQDAAPNVVSLESEHERRHQRRREPNSRRYTAVWEHAGRGCDTDAFALPPALECVEVQVWNRCANGFDVFLGLATVAIASLFHQQQQHSERSADAAVLHTPWMWLPLLLSAETQASLRQRPSLSVQLQVAFVCDARASAIRKRIAQRASERTRHPSDVDDARSDAERATDASKRIADPAFAFTKPFEAVDWSAVASASVRHIFFHADVDRLSAFKRQVLYSDVLHELQDDDGLYIDDGHVQAFQLAQLSAQYLDHCVDMLARRCDDYSDQYRVLIETKRDVAATWSRLKRQRNRLKRERDELDLLLATYKSVAEREQLQAIAVQASESDCVSRRSPAAPSTLRGHSLSSPLKSQMMDGGDGERVASSPSPQALAAKPAFLMTWEERERERKLEKERSKASRIAAEKQRLEQLAEERRAREAHEQRLSTLMGRARDRAATAIQSFLRVRLDERKRERVARARAAAIMLQTCARAYLCRRAYPARREHHRMIREQRCMAQSEAEMRAFVQSERAHMSMLEDAVATDHIRASVDGSDQHADETLRKPDVSALMATWRTLRRIFLLAHAAADHDGTCGETGVLGGYEALFAQLDGRRDGVIDRAELRAGARALGVRIDRKLTRVLVAFVRAKCGDEPRPLVINYVQFVRGFALPSDLSTVGNSANSVCKISNTVGNIVGNVRDSVDTVGDAKEHESADALSTDEEDDAISQVARAVDSLRDRIRAAAALHLEARGKSTGDYKAFRDALAFVFQEVDVDGNGELDLRELVACMRSIGLDVSADNAALLRECFGGSDDSDRISIAEFTSFALARATADDEQLGLIGAKLRDAVLQRVRAARQQTLSIEDAVRLVFRRAYPRKAQQTCSIAAFAKTLDALKLGVKPAQLARLVLRLDANRDQSISFDELLAWLRLRSATECTDSSVLDDRSRHQHDPPTDSRTSEARLDTAAANVSSVRAALQAAMKHDETRLLEWFHSLTGALTVAPAPLTPSQSPHQAMKVRVGVFKTALRAKIGASSAPLALVELAVQQLDSDHSGWVTTLELQRWTFPLRDLPELLEMITACWQAEETNLASAASTDTRDFALELYRRFDADGNGVLAQREIRGGLASFGLQLKAEEVATLTQAFDTDGDGCWSRTEFFALVYKLFPHAIFVSATSASDAPVDTRITSDSTTIASKEEDAEMLVAPHGDNDYANDGFLSSPGSSAASSTRRDSNASSSASSSAPSTGGRDSRPSAVDYSDDFD